MVSIESLTRTGLWLIICPQAGRAFTLCLQLQRVNRALGSAAWRSQKIRFQPAKPREPPLRLNWGFTPNPTYFFCLATEKVCKKRSSPCILADLPRLAPGTKRTRLRLKQLFVLSFASPGRSPSADARDGETLGALFYSKILVRPQTALLFHRSAP